MVIRITKIMIKIIIMIIIIIIIIILIIIKTTNNTGTNNNNNNNNNIRSPITSNFLKINKWIDKQIKRKNK